MILRTWCENRPVIWPDTISHAITIMAQLWVCTGRVLRVIVIAYE